MYPTPLLNKLNLANRGINLFPRLDSVPESTIKTNLAKKLRVKFNPPSRSINSLIGGKSL